MEYQKKILIADDEQFIRAPFAMYLEQLGFEVKTAVNGLEALEIFRTEMPDIIISDLYMPEMDGFTLIREVVAFDLQVPIIVISGADSVKDVLKALTTGAWDYLTKPVLDLNLLKHSVTKALERRDHLIMARKYQKLLEEVEHEQVGEQKKGRALQAQLQKQVLRAKKEWERTVDAIPDLIALYDTEHKIVRLNQAMAQKMNISVESAKGKRVCFFQHRDCGRRQCGCHHAELMKTGKKLFEQITDQTGTIYEVRLIPFLDEESQKIIGSVLHAKDITQRIRAQEEYDQLQARLLQAQKLESVGQLAAGIAHEINTPTQYVASNIDFFNESFRDINAFITTIQKIHLLGQDGVGPAVREALDELDWDYLSKEIPTALAQSREGLDRVRSIVMAMKEFSHPGSRAKEVTNLNRIIETTVTVARNEWKYVADLTTSLAQDLPMVPCLADEISQVILNILVNAAQAIAEKQSRVGSEEKGEIHIETGYDDRYVQISVRDSGMGIPAEIQQRIFDPFYTTKAVGKGTGQGLAIAYDVVKQKHKGDIRVMSTVGKGTTFVLSIPRNSHE